MNKYTDEQTNKKHWTNSQVVKFDQGESGIDWLFLESLWGAIWHCLFDIGRVSCRLTEERASLMDIENKWGDTFYTTGTNINSTEHKIIFIFFRFKHVSKKLFVLLEEEL